MEPWRWVLQFVKVYLSFYLFSHLKSNPISMPEKQHHVQKELKEKERHRQASRPSTTRKPKEIVIFLLVQWQVNYYYGVLPNIKNFFDVSTKAGTTLYFVYPFITRYSVAYYVCICVREIDFRHLIWLEHHFCFLVKRVQN